MPVWQAVRPLGRALSVHQGKGATDELAQWSALGEAAESHAAESLGPDVFRISHAELRHQAIAENLENLRSSDKKKPDPQRIQDWTRTHDLRSGAAAYVPHACVSLDYCLDADPALDRSSMGLGAGTSWDQAIAKALYECLERDAVGSWLRTAPSLRPAREIELETLPPAWNTPWAGALADLQIRLRIFSIPAVIGIPTIVCTVEPTIPAEPFSLSTYGSASSPEPESALFAAFAEAVQSRLTLIAGARDDITPSEYVADRATGSCPPIPPGWCGKSWSTTKACSGTWQTMADRLADAGFERVLIRRLTGDKDFWKVVKVIIPGLGSLRRKRKMVT